jgi:hypothetical protein
MNKENQVPQQSVAGNALPKEMALGLEQRPHEDALRQLERVLLQRKLAPTGGHNVISKESTALRRRQRVGDVSASNRLSHSPVSHRLIQRAPRDPLRESQRDQIAAAWRERITKGQDSGTAKTPSVCKALFPVQASAQAQRAVVTPQRDAGSQSRTPLSAGSSSYHHRVTADFSASKERGKGASSEGDRHARTSGRAGDRYPPQSTVLTDTSLLELENQIANLLEAKCGAEEELGKQRLQCQRAHNENRQLRLQLARLEGALETKNEHWRSVRAELDESQKQRALLRQECDRLQAALEKAQVENQRNLETRDALQRELKQAEQAAEAAITQKEQFYEKELCKLHTACARQERIIDDLQRQWLRLNAMLEDLFVDEASGSENDAPWLSPGRGLRTPQRAQAA